MVGDETSPLLSLQIIAEKNFENLGYFNLKNAEIGQFSVKLVIILGEKISFGCLLRLSWKRISNK